MLYTNYIIRISVTGDNSWKSLALKVFFLILNYNISQQNIQIKEKLIFIEI